MARQFDDRVRVQHASAEDGHAKFACRVDIEADLEPNRGSSLPELRLEAPMQCLARPQPGNQSLRGREFSYLGE